MVYRMGLKKSLIHQCFLLRTLRDALSLTLTAGKTLAEALETLPPGEHYEAGVVSVRKSLSKYLAQLVIA